jgi:trehalose-phosphatase
MSPRRPGADPSKQREVDPLSLEAALRRFAGARPRLVVLDFDGTLAPLVDDPSTSRMSPQARTALRSLVATPDVTVALLSGRSMQDLRSVAQPPPGTLLVASHGAEVEGGERAVDAPSRELLARVHGELEQLATEHPGTRVEVKPTGVVLHTRQARGGTAARATSSALKGPGSHAGVRVLRGKDVVELTVVDADKGKAIDALREQTGAAAVLFAGDDVTDEHGFERLWPANGDIGVKVGEGETAAEFRVGSSEEMAYLLDDLADLLAQR